MSTCAPESGESTALERVSFELRHAQRAFAALIDSHERVGEFGRAQLRSAARRTLSALSADDRVELADWLALQLAAGARDGAESVLGILARTDAGVLARVRRALPARVEALAMRGRANHIVAA